MNRMVSKRFNSRYLIIPLALMFFSGCVYYNTFFMARKKFNEAEESQKKSAEQRTDQEFSQGGGSVGGGRSGVGQGRQRNPVGGGRNNQVIAQPKANPQERNLYEDAIKKASKVLANHPNSKWADDALWLIGKAYFNMGDYGAADRKFKELVTNQPKSKYADDSYYFMGLCQFELENYDLAVDAFDNVQRRFPKSDYISETYLAKGRLAQKQGEYSEAIALFKTYIDKYSGKDSASIAALSLGQCYEALGENFDAYNSYSDVRKYGPSRKLQFEAALAAGTVLLETDSISLGMKILGDLEEDERYFSQLSRIRLKLAEGYMLQDQMEKSIEVYNAITEEDPRSLESAEAYYRLGLIYQNSMFDIQKAKEAFTKAQSENPGSEFRNLALARSAQIAKFETYLMQLQRADSVQTVRKKSGAVTETPPPMQDSVIVESPGNVEDTTGEAVMLPTPPPDSAGASEMPDSTIVEPEYFTVLNTEIDSLPPDSIIGPANSDSSGTEEKTVVIKDQDAKAVEDSLAAMVAQKQAREDSIRQSIIQTGIETRFLLAELYAYELNRPDSARHEYLQIADQYPTSPYAPKSLLAVANLSFSMGDSTAGMGYLRRLVDSYPESPQATVAAETLSYPLDLSRNALGLYETAESLAVDGNNPDSAAVLFGYIADNFPDLAPKAAFARAWAIDLAVNGTDSSAYFAYEAVSRDYPQTVFAQAARERIGQSAIRRDRQSRRQQQPPPGQQPGNEPDTVGKVIAGLPAAPPIKVLGEFIYPQSLLDRRLKGEVLFKIKINLLGKVDDYQIIGPSGETAIDSSATVALLETEFDTSKLDLAQLDTYFSYVIPFERPDINIFNDPYREETKDRH